MKGRTLILGGADIVDGSPVLDVKPYLPFCDSLRSATAPPWVCTQVIVCLCFCASISPGSEDLLICVLQVAQDLPEDALTITEVSITEVASQQLQECWSAKGAAMKELYPSYGEFAELLRQVLSRDVRSVHQRLHRTGNALELQEESPSEGSESVHNKQDSRLPSEGRQPGNQSRRQSHREPEFDARYQVVLQGVRVVYSITESRWVRVLRAESA